MKTPCLSYLPATVLAALFFFSCKKDSSSGSPNVTGTAPVVPLISSIVPGNGPGSMHDTIYGKGFNASIQDTVLFNGVKATVYSASDSELIVGVPSLAGTGQVSAVVNGTTIAGPVFTYDTTYKPTVFATGFDYPQHIAMDGNGNLYVANHGLGNILKVSSGGTVSTFASGFQVIVGVTVDVAGNVCVGSNTSGSSSTIYRINSTGVADSLGYIDGFVWGLTSDPQGNIYVLSQDMTSFLANVIKISQAGVETNVASNVGQSLGLGIVWAPSGVLYVAQGGNGFSGFITEIATGGAVSSMTLSGSPSTFDPAGITVDGSGHLYATSQSDSSVYKISAGGQTEVIATGFYSPYGIALDKAGNVYFTCNTSANDFTGEIVRLTPQ
jgi:sugar lactone lactonase YvrE